MEYKDIIKAHLEKVYTEYITYKNHIKDKVKPLDVIREKFIKEIEGEEDLEKISEKLFEIQEKQTIFLQDLQGLLTRLYHTIEAYKDLLEIPKEILEEVSMYRFEQFYTIKNGKDFETNPEKIKEIKNAIKQNMKPILKAFDYR